MGLNRYAGDLTRRVVRRGLRSAARAVLERADRVSQERGGPAIPMPEELRRDARASRRSKGRGPVVQGEVIDDDRAE